MCIKETLRLYTLVPFIGKLSSEDVVVDGYRIPKGMRIQLQIIANCVRIYKAESMLKK